MPFDFMGKSYHTLDQKKRLSVPVRFRAGLGETFIICKPLAGMKCIYLYNEEAWNELVESVKQKTSGETRTLVVRRLFLNAQRVEADKQGRITISSDYCEFANIEKEICVFGAGQRVEIWNKDSFNAVEAENAQEDNFDYGSIDY